MKIQNYTKSIKIKSQQLSWGGEKSWSARSFFPYISYEHVIAQWWKHCCIWGLCLRVTKVVPLLTELLFAMWLYMTAASSYSTSRKQMSLWLYVHLSPNQHTHKPWVSCSSALSHWGHLFFFPSNNWRKWKSEATIIRPFFFCLLLAYSCPSLFLKVTLYALPKWIHVCLDFLFYCTV